MKITVFFTILIMVFGGCGCGEKAKISPARDPYTRMQEINWTDVTWTDGFWADKIELCRNEMIPALYRGLTSDSCVAQLHNLEVVAGMKEGKFQGLDWSDGDCYKWIESMAWVYALTKDPALDSTMDAWIKIIAKAQLPDGYISTNMQLKEGRSPYMPFPKPNAMGGMYHELYNQGHLITTACIHYRATGKRDLLDIAIKQADRIVDVFKPGAPELLVTSGNLPIIMGLVELYHVTGNRKYIETAKVIVDARGNLSYKNDVSQDHVPFREEDQATGHAVFATYLYAGVSDLYSVTGEKALFEALERIWKSAELRRAYITGALGSFRNGASSRGDIVWEGIGADYQVPDRTAYNETCANIGNAMWNWRMAKITGDAKYTDIIETVLYNSMLPGVSLDGRTFFYKNPLSWYIDADGKNGPHPNIRNLFIGFCCPPSITRTIAGLGRWAYSVSDDTLWVNLYGSNNLETTLPGGKRISLSQESDYPRNGSIKITVKKAPPKSVTLMLRIPGWSENASLKVAGTKWDKTIVPGSYLAVNRKWKSGDVLELDLPIKPKLMEANPRVVDCRGKVAVMRGPVVYCAEFPLSEKGDSIWHKGFYISENALIEETEGEGVFKGITVLKTTGLNKEEHKSYVNKLTVPASVVDSSGWEDILYRKFKPYGLPVPGKSSVSLTLIPYYAWANRGPAYMTVWIPVAK